MVSYRRRLRSGWLRRRGCWSAWQALELLRDPTGFLRARRGGCERRRAAPRLAADRLHAAAAAAAAALLLEDLEALLQAAGLREVLILHRLPLGRLELLALLGHCFVAGAAGVCRGLLLHRRDLRGELRLPALEAAGLREVLVEHGALLLPARAGRVDEELAPPLQRGRLFPAAAAAAGARFFLLHAACRCVPQGRVEPLAAGVWGGVA
mmetsp:Transcript_148737/g.386729  ORF Transcript_148737/g.386729 Transcript_148737/m.386729 type:complete len:209 (+) Transcript_148737:1150-1776(+)